MALADLLVNIGANIQAFESDLANVVNISNKAAADVEKAFKPLDQLGAKLSDTGKSLSLAISAPILAIGGAAAKAAGDFEQSMNAISAKGEIVGTDLQKLENFAIEMGAKTAFSAKEAADAMVDLAAKGFDTTQIMAALPGIMSMAATDNLQLARASEIATGALKQFGLAASETGRIADVLAKAAAKTDTDINALGEGLEKVGPFARLAGQSFEQTVSQLALLSEGTIKGADAGTQLKGVLASLVNPSKDVQKTLDSLGVSVKNAAGNMRPLPDILQDLKDKGASAGQMVNIFGREAVTAATVLRDQGAPAIKNFNQELLNSQGFADKTAATMRKGLKGALEEMKGAIETAGIAFGKILSPGIEAGANAIKSFVENAVLPAIKAFQTLPDGIKVTAGAIAGIAVAAGPALVITGQLIQSYGTVKAALTGTNAAFLATGTAIHGTTGKMGEAVKNSSALAGAFDLLKGAAIAWTAVMAVQDVASMASSFMYLGERIKAVVDATQEHTAATRPAVTAMKEATQEAYGWGDALDNAAKRAKTIKWEDIRTVFGVMSRNMREAADSVDYFSGQYEAMYKGLARRTKELADTSVAAAKRQIEFENKHLNERVEMQRKLTEQQRLSAEEAEKAAKRIAASWAGVGVKNVVAELEESKKQFAIWSAAGKGSAEQVAQAMENLRLKQVEVNKVSDEVATHLKNNSDFVSHSLQALIYKHSEWIVEAQRIRLATIEYEKFNSELTKLGDVGNTAGKNMETLYGHLTSAAKAAADTDAAAQKLGVTLSRDVKIESAQLQAAFEQIRNSGTSTARDIDLAWIQLQEKLQAIGVKISEADKQRMEELKIRHGLALSQAAKDWEFLKGVATDSLHQIGNGLVDLVIQGGKFGDVLINTAKQAGQAILDYIVHGAIDNLIKGLKTGELSFQSLFDMAKKVGEGIADIFKGASKAVAEVAGGVGSAGAGAANAGGGAAAAGPSPLGTVDMISGIATAITGLLSYLQGRRMEKDIGRIEVTTRGQLNQLIALQETFNQYLPWLENLANLQLLQGIHDSVMAIADSAGTTTRAVENATETIDRAVREAGERQGSAVDHATTETVEAIDETTDAVKDGSDKIVDRGEDAQDRTTRAVEEGAAETVKEVIPIRKAAEETTAAVASLEDEIARSSDEAIAAGNARVNEVVASNGEIVRSIVATEQGAAKQRQLEIELQQKYFGHVLTADEIWRKAQQDTAIWQQYLIELQRAQLDNDLLARGQMTLYGNQQAETTQAITRGTDTVASGLANVSNTVANSTNVIAATVASGANQVAAAISQIKIEIPKVPAPSAATPAATTPGSYTTGSSALQNAGIPPAQGYQPTRLSIPASPPTSGAVDSIGNPIPTRSGSFVITVNAQTSDEKKIASAVQNVLRSQGVA